MSFRLRGAISSKFFGAPKLRWTSLDEFNPQSEFFANNEQGIWLDLSDMTTAKANWRRNLLGYTQELNNSYWATANATITADFAIDPSGMMVADRVVETVANGEHRVQNNVTLAFVSGVTYTVSGLFKAGEVTSVRLGFDEPVKLPGRVFFNLSNGTIAFTEYGSGTITSIGDGWYRCTVTGTCSTGYSGRIEVNLVQPSTTVIYAGSTSNGLLVSSLQLEVGNAATDYQRILDFGSDFKQAFVTHSLYQDSNGLTPSTTTGDPVGLVIDRSKGGITAASSELHVDPNINAIGSWVVNSGVSISEGKAIFDGTNASGYARAQGGMTAGRWYMITVVVSSVTAGALRLLGGGPGNTVGPVPLTSTAGTFSIMHLADANTVGNLWLYSSSGPFAGTVESISVKEIYGNHAYQTTSGSRPTLGRVPSGGRRNLLTYSEQLDNAVWIKSGTGVASAPVVTANQAANPLNGDITADLVVFNLNGGTLVGDVSQIGFNNFASAEYTSSFYAKTSDGTTKAMTFVGAAGNSIAITITGTWQRFSTTGTGTGFPRLRLRGAGSGETTADSASIYLFGWQHEISSAVTNYQRVTTTYDVTETGFNDSWHLVFDGSDDSLITNTIDFSTATIGTRKNFLINTEDFSQNWTLPFVTVTMNAIAAPDGSLTADKIVETVDNNQHFVYQNYAPSNGQVCTLSVYAKAAERTWISMQGGGTGGIWFNLSNGTIGTNLGGGFTGTIENAGNGWYRCSISGTWTSQTNYILIRPSDGGYSYTGDGTSGLYLWGAQLEFGSTMTSYQRVGTERMTIFAGVRKLSDAADGLIAELSANSNSNAGSLYITAPEVTASLSYSSLSRGSAVASANQRANITSAAAPETAVITATHDISADSSTMRRNGVVGASATGDKGSGDFGNYQLFIGRRNQATVPLNGHIYQLIILGRSCTATKTAEAERYIGKLIGVTL